MSRKTKKVLAIILMIAITISVGSLACAKTDTVVMDSLYTECQNDNEIMLTNSDFSTFDNVITQSVTVDEDGMIVRKFDNIDSFILKVKENNPDISDYQIAEYILQFIGQDCEAIPESEILKVLNYKSITSSDSYVTIDEEGNVYKSTNEAQLCADWTSLDNCMKITTNYAYQGMEDDEESYSVWSTATWLIYPSWGFTDLFTLGTNATYVNGSTFGSVNQTFDCTSGCNKRTYRGRSVTSSDTSDGDLALKYSSGLPVLEFDALTPTCDYCGGGATDAYFSTYISYEVLISGSKNIYASYAHKTIAPGVINITFGSDGKPNFSVGILGLEEYEAEGLEVKN